MAVGELCQSTNIVNFGSILLRLQVQALLKYLEITASAGCKRASVNFHDILRTLQVVGQTKICTSPVNYLLVSHNSFMQEVLVLCV